MPTVALFDEVFARLGAARLSFTEGDALATLWGQGEDAWLREDERFRPTPWRRWIGADRYLVNDLIERELRLPGVHEVALDAQLALLAEIVRCPTAFCPADPRFAFDSTHRTVRRTGMAAPDEPTLENVGPLFQFVTHLPYYDLAAVAASQPAGEWGQAAEPQGVTCRGWVAVPESLRPLRRHQFVAQIRGRSMDGGKSPIPERALAIFRFAYHDGKAYDSGAARPIVLVRGGFTDPELGNYAVKRWARSAETLTLESTNRNRIRFPDIVVPPDRLDDVRIVATFDAVLAELADKLGKKPGRRGQRGAESDRDLDDATLAARLQSARDEGVSEVEAETTPERTENEAPSPPEGRWQTEWVCRDAVEGGVHLHFGPFGSRLRPAINRLRFSDPHGRNFTSLASNARQRPDRRAVSPASGPWSCVPESFEPLAARLGFAALGCQPLPADAVSVFHVDAEGEGRLQRTGELRLRERYHVLVPPALAADVPGVDAGDGWRQWTLTPSVETFTALEPTLAGLDLRIGLATPAVRFVGLSPRDWRQTRPVFAPTDRPFLRLSALPETLSEGCLLVLHGPPGLERVQLPTEPVVYAELPALELGRWVALVTHRNRAFPEVSLAFEVADVPSRCVPAALVVELPCEAEGASGIDLADAPLSLGRVRLTGPPGWPVVARWHDVQSRSLGRAWADADGRYASLPFEAQEVQRRAGSSPIARLSLDFLDLGRRTLCHVRRPSLDTLAAWIERQASFVETHAGDWDLLATRWFAPLCTRLGYAFEPARSIPGATPVDGRLVVSLDIDRETHDGVDTMVRHRTRILVMAREPVAVIKDDRPWLEEQMRVAAVLEAVVTNGKDWCLVRNYVRTQPRVWTIGSGLTALDLGDFVERFAGTF